MKDVAALLHLADTLSPIDESVLVTLVKIEGSAYRRPGARMLVLPGCRTVGTISGGCLESTVARQAWAATRNNHRTVLEIESAPEDDAWGPASGCHGNLFLLAEPIPAGQRHPTLQLLAKIRAGDQPAIIAHHFDVHPDGTLIPSTTRLETTDQCDHHDHHDHPKSTWRQNGNHAAFIECVATLPHLLICGAGDDAIPVARIAAELGWRISVVDSRARFATRERFPTIHQLSTQGPPALPALLKRNTAAVVMSHRFGDDVDYLAELLQHEISYIGLLGPRRRADRMLSELADRSPAPPAPPLAPEQLARIFSPIGLNLGAEGPEAIALSIVAEIQAALADRDGRPLSEKVGPMQIPEPGTPCLP